MSNEYEAIARMLLKTPEGGAVVKNLDEIRKILDTPEGRALLTSLSGSGGDAFKEAAKTAAADKDAASALIRSLISTPEGGALVQRIMGVVGKPKGSSR